MKQDITTVFLQVAFLQLVWVLNVELPITESYFGCVDDADICTKLCRVGFAKCDNPKNIKCEYNYFKLNLNSNTTECVLCPYTYDDPWMYLCMDCRENSENWQNTRTCSYNYKIQSGNKQGAYIRENMTNPVLFNIKHTLQIGEVSGRNATVLYTVEECAGCSDFCDESSDTCNVLEEAVDIIHSGIICNDGYYFSGDGCQKCSINNCKVCDWQECYECLDGYAYNYTTLNCDICFDGCKSCSYYGETLYCDACNQDVYYDYRISINYGEQCDYCDYGCDRCSIYYETRIDDYGDEYEIERNKCRQCQYGYVLTDSGSTCDTCYIENCEICFYSFKFGDVRQYTYQFDFNWAQDWDSFQTCYKCENDYTLVKDPDNADRKICSSTPQTVIDNNPDCLSFSQLETSPTLLICLSCKNQYSLEYFSPTVNICNQEQICNKKIKYCQECISFLVSGIKQYQCLKCDKGYYPDIFAGLCVQCQAKCEKCWQYSDSYNITDYLQLQMAALNPDQYKSDLLQLQSEKLNDPWCTQCAEGFDLYENACLGCTDDCVSYNKQADKQEPACQYADNYAYCTQCLLPAYQQSLTPDLSQCNECPENCIACRERSQTEIAAINPFFNPDFDQLQKFSSFCYKSQVTIKSTKTLNLDPYLGIPIECTATDKNKKCEKQLFYSTEISCDSTGTVQLPKLLKQQKGKIATISLSEVDKEENYYYLNQQTITSANITITFVKGTSKFCAFTKTTQIKSGLQRNVFTLQKLTLKIIGDSWDSDQIIFQQTGRLILQDYSAVVIQNIQFVEASSGDFGLEIIGTKTSLTMINCSVKKNNKLSSFSMILQNTIQLELSQVSFTNINNDNIINQTSTSQLTDPSSFTFNDVTISSSVLSYGLITVNQIGTNNTLSINNFQILSTTLNNTQLFNDLTTNSPFDVTLTKTSIVNSTFTNSSMFVFTTVKKLEIQQFNFAVNKLEKSSTLITSTSFNILKFFSFRALIMGNSCLFKSGSYLYYAQQTEYANLYNFNFMTFQQNTCQNVNCLMKLQTPENIFSLKTNIKMSNLKINQTTISQIQAVDVNSVTSALISLNTVGNIYLQTLTIINSQGLSIFFISGSYALDLLNAQYYLIMENSIYYSYDSYLSDEGDDFDLNYSIGDNVVLTNPTNNYLPVSVDCAERKMAAYEFSSYLFYIEGFRGYVNVSNIIITDQIFIDRSAFVIKSYQNLQYIEPEVIIISDVKFLFNYLASITNGQEMSLILIESQQSQIINISSILFESNHLHQVVDQQISETPLALMVDSPYSYFHIEKGYFNYNRVTRSLNGLIWAKVNSMQFNQTYFYKTNIIDKIWLGDLEESQLNVGNETLTRANLMAYFTVQSYGANIYAIVSTVDFRQINIEQSYGVSGAGIYLELTDGIVYITESSFSNIQSSLSSTDNTEGGCLLINSESSNLQMKLENVLMLNCVARTRGGCIHIFPTKFRQNLFIVNSKFTQCQSFGYSFISNPFLESTDSPSVYLEKTIISDNNYDIFVNNIPNLSLLEQLMLTQDSGIYYQHTGILDIRDCSFTNFKYIGIIKTIKMKRVTISGTQMQSNIIYIMPLIHISLDPIDDNFLSVIDSEFSNNNSTMINSTQRKCDSFILKQQSTTIDAQNCDIIDYLIDFQNYYEPEPLAWNDESYIYEFHNNYSENDGIKYEIPELYDMFYLEESELISRFDTTQNSSLINCLLSNMLNITLEAGQTLTTSLLFLENAYSNSYVKFEKTNIISNQCLRCYAGLIQLLGVVNAELDEPLIELRDVKCEKSIVGYYGCFLIQSLKDIMNFVPNQNLQKLSTQDNRLLQLNGNQTIGINNSEFTNNKAVIGSGVAIIGLSALVNGSVFYDNSASLAGAGIYYINLGENASSQLFVNNLTFQNNHAQVGAALYLQDTELANVDKLDITFDYNQAKYAQTLQENTRRQTIQMVEGEYIEVETYQDFSGDYNDDGNVDDINQIIQDNITFPYQNVGNYPNKTNLLILPSGQPINTYRYFLEETQEYIPYEWRFRIINLNRFYEHVVNDKDGDKCQIQGRIQNFNEYDENIQFTNNFTTPSVAPFSENDEGYILDSMQVIFDPSFDFNYYLELRFECNTIKIPVYGEAPFYDIIGYDQRYYLFANIRTFPCQKGEVYQLMSCLPCNPKSNQYSVTKDATICSQFNSDYMIAIKQSSIQLKAGYWRPDYSNDQTEVCENQNSNCKGGWVPGDPSCYTGHIGALCESCDLYSTVNEEAYTQSSPFKCARCAPTMQLNYVVLVATSIVSFISMVLAVKGSYLSSMQFIIEDTFDKWGVLLKSEQSDLAVLMKVLTNYFQIIQFIASFGITIPTSLTQTAKTAGNPTESTTTAMDCLYATMTDLDVLYFRMVWSFIQPSIYLIGFYFFYFIGIFLNLLPYKINIVTTALIYQFLYLQPTYVEGFIVLASSRTVSGLPFVQRDVAYRYDSSQHQYYLINYITPMLIVWVLVLPLLCMYLVYKNRATLEGKQTKLIYGFFYLEYQINSYLWEFVKLFQKEFMVIILAYYDAQVIVKGLLLVVVMFLYGFYQISVSPYKNTRLNNLDRYSTVILSISLAMGVLLKSCQDNNFGYLFIIIAIIIIFINIPFLISILYYIFEGYIVKFSPILDKIRDILNEKYPELKSKYPFLRPYLYNKEKMGKRVKELWGILRQGVYDSKAICKEYQLPFKKVFPPYALPNEEGLTLGPLQQEEQIIQCQEKKPLISEAQESPPEDIPKEDQQQNIRVQSILASGVKQQGQFYTSSFITQTNQEEAIGVTGKGIEQWPDNTQYEGQLVNSLKQGKGKVTWPMKEGQKQQEYYEGNFENDKFSDYGIYQWGDGKRYEGMWKNGLRHGYGKYHGNNQYYEGEFENDQYHGQGMLKIGNKQITGKFVKGKMDGEMKIIIDKKMRRVIWKNGQFEEWID